jgi:hypothetical protein
MAVLKERAIDELMCEASALEPLPNTVRSGLRSPEQANRVKVG